MRHMLLLCGLLVPLPLTAQELRATATLTGYKHYNVVALAFSSDSKTLAIGTTDGVQLWDVARHKELALLNPPSPQENWSVLAFSPDAKLLAGSGQGSVVLWDLQTNRYQTHFPGTASALAWTGDGRYIVAFAGRAHLRIWDLEKRRLHVEYANRDYGDCVAIASNGKDLVLGTGSGCIFVKDAFVVDPPWTPDSRPQRLPDPHWRIDGVGMTTAIGPNCQRFAIGEKEGTIILGGLETTQTQKFIKAHKSWAMALAFSADGLTLASGSSDKTIKFWDAITGEPLATLTGHTDRISGLAFSPDGKTLASGSHDRTVKLWDVSGVVKRKLGK